MKQSKILYLSLIILGSISLFSCGVTNLRSSDLSYSDYEEFYLDSLESFYSQDEDRYIVYLYSNSCTHCENIKGNLFDHLDELKEDGTGIATYIYNMYSSSSSEGSTNRSYFKIKEDDYDQDELVAEMIASKPTLISETYFFGTPSLYVIENNAFSNFYIGATDCANFLDSN